MMRYILGLDIGVQSIGFAIVEVNENNIPIAVKHLGVRCFDSVMDNINDWKKGTTTSNKTSKAKTNNCLRREKRGIRRRIWRIQRRKKALLNLLRRFGLLPIGNGLNETSKQQQEFINNLDKKLSEQLGINNRLPYQLRALALDEKLEPFALGRAFLNLGQRRGFKSNKKTEKPDDKEEFVVKQGISDLQKEIDKNNCRTLGEYFASLNPDETRIRQRWTSRSMFENEFDKICNAQEKYYKDLFNAKVVLDAWRTESNRISRRKKGQKPLKPKTMTLRQAIKHFLFFQRPLKSQRHLIGKCMLEPKKRRAQAALLSYQEFRYWQKILDMEIYDSNGSTRKLTPSELETLAKTLEHKEELSFDTIRKLLGLNTPKGTYKFNLEETKEKKIKGNITATKIQKIIPTQWNTMSSENRNILVSEILQFSDKSALARRLAKVFQFDKDSEENEKIAARVADVSLEKGYANLSLKAIDKILKIMKEQHLSYITARDQIYSNNINDIKFDNKYKDKNNKKLLPVLLVAPGMKQPHLLRKAHSLQTGDNKNIQANKKKKEQKRCKSYTVQNPIVLRVMTELKKIINAILRKYGLPEKIHTELARDLKKCRKARERYKAQADANKEQRERIQAIIKKLHGEAASKNEYNILKWRLAEECKWQCPYTGKKIVPNNLDELKFFDIEHILPFSKSLDNSFANKTLCDSDYNKNIKKNLMPYELPKFLEILNRVKNFTVPQKQSLSKKNTEDSEKNNISNSKNDKSKTESNFNPKWKRFQMKDIPPDLPTQLLNDTRYVSKAAGDYLGLLYGGQVDAAGKRRILVSSGGITNYLCKIWKLYESINENKNNKKNREDHRHHAIDAVAIALCSPKLVTTISREAEKVSERYESGKGWAMPEGLILLPIQDLNKQVEEAVKNINVSRRINRKVKGGFHEETNYSPSQFLGDKNSNKVEYRHIRKPLQSMSKKKINNIVDPVIRQLVQKKLERLGDNPKKFTENELPYITTKSGHIIPIRKARFRQKISVITLALNTAKERHVAPGNNHHVEIFEVLDKKGNVKKIDWRCVNLYESMQRIRAKQPVIARSNHYGDGTPTRLKFSLAKGEYVQATPPSEPMVLLRVCKISDGDVSLCLHSDARPEKLRSEKNQVKRKAISQNIVFPVLKT
ncbi:MAG: type II CRISPR RNA-guided endonuclease Cas9 [Planctomycetaceae bacterium]|nr:type II CRISPR RNA-guided endonuclease Cas9 [Planctomycetaceae bacterium]